MIDQSGSCSMPNVSWFPFKTRTGPADRIFRSGGHHFHVQGGRWMKYDIRMEFYLASFFSHGSFVHIARFYYLIGNESFT